MIRVMLFFVIALTSLPLFSATQVIESDIDSAMAQNASFEASLDLSSFGAFDVWFSSQSEGTRNEITNINLETNVEGETVTASGTLYVRWNLQYPESIDLDIRVDGDLVGEANQEHIQWTASWDGKSLASSQTDPVSADLLSYQGGNDNSSGSKEITLFVPETSNAAEKSPDRYSSSLVIEIKQIDNK